MDLEGSPHDVARDVVHLHAGRSPSPPRHDAVGVQQLPPCTLRPPWVSSSEARTGSQNTTASPPRVSRTGHRTATRARGVGESDGLFKEASRVARAAAETPPGAATRA